MGEGSGVVILEVRISSCCCWVQFLS